VEGGTKSRNGANKNKEKEKQVFLGAIMGRFAAPRNASKWMAKRKMADLMAVHVTMPKSTKMRLIMGFTDDEKINGGSSEIFLLVVITRICSHDVARCLIDKGSSVDILYEDAFENLGLKKKT